MRKVPSLIAAIFILMIAGVASAPAAEPPAETHSEWGHHLSEVVWKQHAFWVKDESGSMCLWPEGEYPPGNHVLVGKVEVYSTCTMPDGLSKKQRRKFRRSRCELGDHPVGIEIRRAGGGAVGPEWARWEECVLRPIKRSGIKEYKCGEVVVGFIQTDNELLPPCIRVYKNGLRYHDLWVEIQYFDLQFFSSPDH